MVIMGDTFIPHSCNTNTDNTQRLQWDIADTQTAF